MSGRDRPRGGAGRIQPSFRHTQHAISFTIVAVAWFPFLALPLIVFAVLVAMSRVVLDLHYPTDVLAGVLIGTALGAASVWTCSASLAAIT